ncbi:MAG: hypothetical protein QJR13_07505, partial [Bacillota bacterium]|nr:hypothetical protein [Bacillota bacterium]
TTPWECKARYERLEQAQTGLVQEAGKEPTGAAWRREKPEEDILDVLKDFPEQARKLEERLRVVEDDLKTLKERHRIQLEDLVAGLTKLSQVVAERDRLHQQLEDTRRELEQLREERAKEHQQLEAERQELRAVYDDLNTVLGEFMQLSSMDKLRVLGDFAARLEVTVDRFGNVVRTRRRV